MERFREAIDKCDLSDLGYSGSKFTWCNKREREEFTKKQLDSALGNGFLSLLCSNCEVHVLPVLNSNHSPLLVSCDNGEDEVRRTQRIFRYGSYWFSNQEYKAIIERS